MTLTHDDYTVAWICALSLESAAAKASLDEVHPRLSQPQSDSNAYTLGTINGHNVVIVCLPAGDYGTTPAATVVAQMRLTFPRLRFGLMVGIGGGVPSEQVDIRLGDIVVSTPTGIYGGVVEYDYGKTIQDGRLQRMSRLNKPPHQLLTAVADLRSDSIITGASIGTAVSRALQKDRNLSQTFSRPSNDWLFKPTYNHPVQNSDCSSCDYSELVNRAPRATGEPVIHYGLIASGNWVMKDAKTRDTLARELNILCFEMEAAGLMDQLPCLVIRGICDYCDSHKHKDWQPYAALTAAVFAKQLLSVVPLSAIPDSCSESTYFSNIIHKRQRNKTVGDGLLTRSKDPKGKTFLQVKIGIA
jgi:nucleoside phosphorylase